jgi:hypothetical protein
VIENKIRHTDEKLQELFLNYNKKFNMLRDDVFKKLNIFLFFVR